MARKKFFYNRVYNAKRNIITFVVVGLCVIGIIVCFLVVSNYKNRQNNPQEVNVLNLKQEVMVEVNENLPWVNGLNGAEINIADVDMVVEGDNPPVAAMGAAGEPTDIDKAVAKLTILDRISEDTPDCTESSLKQHISNLRKKLRDVSGSDYIEAVWGIGFTLRLVDKEW